MNDRRMLIAATLFALLVSPLHAYNWLTLAMAGAHSYPDISQHEFDTICQSFGLNPVQTTICQQHPFAMPSVGKGARDSVDECRAQFRYERWNCTERFMIPSNTTKFAGLLDRTLNAGNRETAFISAITSAGIVHAVTKGCSTGNLTECGCDNRYTNGQMRGPNNEKWSWGGCSDNVDYGIKFAKQFLDRFEKDQFHAAKQVNHLMNLHNNMVGRESIVKLMRRQCRCHGVSGSCEFKTCWQQMPKFNEIGEVLKQRYNHFAVQVAKRAKKRLRRKERSERKVPLRENEIVFINRSPNYCERNDSLGILGTQGRECNQTSLQSDSCDLLCCGRGYNTREEVRSFRCGCKFVWCCYVKCRTCEETVQVHTCK
uniref:Protein Wnt n=1 Tax=Plectus sambesii TaxID=2011161 RepID=A0A914X7Z0_9BILA